jgi:malonate transporter MadL subunit
MIIYGLALLAICYLIGQWLGDLLGKLIHIPANMGGIGFGMILLMVFTDWLQRKKYWTSNTELGIQYWSQLYVPIIIAMASVQNVYAAIHSGWVAVLAGFIPVLIGFGSIPWLIKWAGTKMEQHG